MKSHIIRKSNELVEARYRLSIWEQRMILLLLVDISPKDEDFKRYRIRVDHVAAMWNLDSDKSLYDKVQQAADTLVGKTIQLSDDPEISQTVSWLAYVEYVKGSGVIELEFHSSLKPYLLQLKKYYTEYKLGHVISFRNQYTIRIYELLKMEAFKANTGGHFVRRFQYEELRSMLDVAANEYHLFADFKRRVILPSVKEISGTTDLNIHEVQYGKTGRKITDITFIVAIRPPEDVPTFELESETPSTNSKQTLHPVIGKLVELGFALDMAKRYKNKYGVRKIERNIAYTLAKRDAGVIKDVPAYLNTAISEDLGQAWDAERKQTVKKQATTQKVVEQREKQAEAAHMQKMAELAGVPIDDLFSKT